MQFLVDLQFKKDAFRVRVPVHLVVTIITVAASI